jgi:hypothetical protein
MMSIFLSIVPTNESTGRKQTLLGWQLTFFVVGLKLHVHNLQLTLDSQS